MDEALAISRECAQKYGWRPAAFGASAFDSGLCESVAEFQRHRLLPVTGAVDYRTYKVLLEYRAAVAEGRHTRRRARRRIGRGAASRFPKGHPVVRRSEPLAGVLLDWDGVETPWVSIPAGRGRVTVLIVPIAAGLPPITARAAARGVGVAARVRAREGGDIDCFRRSGWDGPVVLDLGAGEGPGWGGDLEAARSCLEKIRGAVGEGPTVGIRMVHRERPKDRAVRALWREVALACDVLMPVHPSPRFLHSPVEWALSQMVTEWGVASDRIRHGPVTVRTFPHLRTSIMSKVEILRARKHLVARGVRGYGYEGPVRDMGHGVYYGELGHVSRVDNAITRVELMELGI